MLSIKSLFYASKSSTQTQFTICWFRKITSRFTRDIKLLCAALNLCACSHIIALTVSVVSGHLCSWSLVNENENFWLMPCIRDHPCISLLGIFWVLSWFFPHLWRILVMFCTCKYLRFQKPHGVNDRLRCSVFKTPLQVDNQKPVKPGSWTKLWYSVWSFIWFVTICLKDTELWTATDSVVRDK